MAATALTDEFIQQIGDKIRQDGTYTQEELAEYTGHSEKQIREWLSKGRKDILMGREDTVAAKFLLEVKAAQDEYNTDKVEKSLVARALGYEYDEVTTEEVRVPVRELERLGVEGIPDEAKRTGVYVKISKQITTTKQVQPNIDALKYWLNNRASFRWSSARQINVDVSGQVDSRHLYSFVDASVNRQAQGNTIDVTKLDDETLDKLQQAFGESAQREKQVTDGTVREN